MLPSFSIDLGLSFCAPPFTPIKSASRLPLTCETLVKNEAQVMAGGGGKGKGRGALSARGYILAAAVGAALSDHVRMACLPYCT